MSSSSRSFDESDRLTFAKGQRLYCQHCGAEIEIINPTTCRPPNQEFRCCDELMQPAVGASVNVNVERPME